jgi:hypothetical protein
VIGSIWLRPYIRVEALPGGLFAQPRDAILARVVTGKNEQGLIEPIDLRVVDALLIDAAGQEAPIHDQDFAIGIRSRIGGQEDSSARHFFDRAETADRRP